MYDERDRTDHDPRDGLMHDLDLPRGEARELVVDREHMYELNGEDSCVLAVVGAFRVVPERELGSERDDAPDRDKLWVQASLDQKQRLQQLFFPDGVAFDGNRFNRTAATAPFFKYLAPSECADEKMVTQIFTSWNQMSSWLSQLQGRQRAA